jgi:predicted DsbA family dithiol-disulfide isomerase
MKRLQKAIEVYKKVVPGGSDDTFTLSWSPFYLDPTLPKEGIPHDVRMAEKFGADRMKPLKARMTLMGQSEGICFNFDRKIGNTRDAHRLMQLAKSKGSEVENKTMASLFQDHFEGGGDITSHEMLMTAGEKAGLDRDEMKKWLEKDSGGKEVDRAVDEAYSMGIQGVPHFIINNSFEVSGAQDPQTFLEEFARAKAAAT